ncbi:zinc-binding dehydrogenase [Actinomycetospora callitridis]|uniref:zinc-binding dehydrogenase n=1 Tax=Actinomycetospora callitridis TaxID=913944 RepID=UPI0023667566|nr:zinc-binding dehydrogenase [Actinomycetospora callitridis]MDD7921796.1 zinc-binding dehydrogenase [Actinomycetospora callitridis]
MRRVVCRAFGPVEDLEIVEEPDPEPGPGEVLVEVEAAGVSFVDALIVRGGYQLRPDLPFTPGTSLCGRVAAVGAGVGADAGSPAVGDRVAALVMDFGAHTSHVTLPAGRVAAVPDGVDPAVAATALESYSTLLFAVTHRVPVEPGDHVVVLGAGGGIGLAAVDVARSRGAHVVAVASSEEKQRAALAAGAEHAVGYTDLKNDIRRLTGGGAHLVVDPVGGAASESALRALRPYGRFAVLGFTSGEIPKLPANVVLIGNHAVVGVDWGDWARTDPDAATALVADLLARVARGELRPPRPALRRLDEAGDALALFARRAVTGKIALVPG